MYQLVYTSAPRLLEAGKTGFGTVARSRQLPQPLVSYLERLSGFDRAAGVDAYFLYSSFAMGNLVYHTFTRIGDCGVDYTRRTNHIAHHWILPQDDSTLPLILQTTPAAIMAALQCQWLTEWQDFPRWYEEPFQQILPASMQGDAWAHFTGDANNRYWLDTKETADGANIILPETSSDRDTLNLLHEAMEQRTDLGWGVGFITAHTSTVSRKICPLVCISPEQQAKGIIPTSGYTEIHINRTLQAPVVPDVAPFAPPLLDIQAIQPQEIPPPLPPDIPSCTPETITFQPTNQPLHASHPEPEAPAPRSARTSYVPKVSAGIMLSLACGGILYALLNKEEQPAAPVTPPPSATPSPITESPRQEPAFPQEDKPATAPAAKEQKEPKQEQEKKSAQEEMPDTAAAAPTSAAPEKTITEKETEQEPAPAPKRNLTPTSPTTTEETAPAPAADKPEQEPLKAPAAPAAPQPEKVVNVSDFQIYIRDIPKARTTVRCNKDPLYFSVSITDIRISLSQLHSACNQLEQRTVYHESKEVLPSRRFEVIKFSATHNASQQLRDAQENSITTQDELRKAQEKWNKKEKYQTDKPLHQFEKEIEQEQDNRKRQKLEKEMEKARVWYHFLHCQQQQEEALAHYDNLLKQETEQVKELYSSNAFVQFTVKKQDKRRVHLRSEVKFTH